MHGTATWLQLFMVIFEAFELQAFNLAFIFRDDGHVSSSSLAHLNVVIVCIIFHNLLL